MYIALISANLRRLRHEKAMTQEQIAVRLGVSTQSVSRWECGNSLPDVILLPELAKLYGITVDDLFREVPVAYPSYAQRLLAVYEDSGRPEDFLAAEQEFMRIKEPTADDLRAWGVLHHYMMKHCARRAEQLLHQAMNHPEAGSTVSVSAAQQRLALLCDLGKGEKAVAEQDNRLAQDPSDPQQWLLAAAAHHYAGENDKALEVAREGVRRFPDYGLLYVYAGDICRALRRYEEAFGYWENARERDASMLDAVYSMAYCYEELEQYSKAQEIWEELARELMRRGMHIESRYPLERAKNCMER